MFLLTRDFDVAPLFADIRYGLGVWTDIQQNESYYYCSSIEGCGIPGVVLPIKQSAVFRFNTNYLKKWEFVGRVDFFFKNATISLCGNYFWSVNIIHHYNPRSVSIILRKIEIRTLKYEVFQVQGWLLYEFFENHETLGLDPNIIDIRHYQLYFIQNFGSYLFIYQLCHPDEHHAEQTDVIFKIHVNEVCFVDRFNIYFENLNLRIKKLYTWNPFNCPIYQLSNHILPVAAPIIGDILKNQIMVLLNKAVHCFSAKLIILAICLSWNGILLETWNGSNLQ